MEGEGSRKQRAGGVGAQEGSWEEYDQKTLYTCMESHNEIHYYVHLKQVGKNKMRMVDSCLLSEAFLIFPFKNEALVHMERTCLCMRQD